MRPADWMVLRGLIFCFPAGLLMMWGNKCRWPRALKCAISSVFALLLMAIVLPQASPPERAAGGVEIVSLVPAVEVQGPELAEGELPYEVYVPQYVPEKSIIVEPTPTPAPIYVYCNDGGQYYHTSKCRYVKDTTPKVTLSQAVSAGYKRCKECDAPKASLAG